MYGGLVPSTIDELTIAFLQVLKTFNLSSSHIATHQQTVLSVQ